MNISPLAKSGIFLSIGVFIFGFIDNLTLLISDQVSVGQFHFTRSIVACSAVLLIAYYRRENIIPINWSPVLLRTFFNTLAMLLYFGVIPMMPIAEAGAGLFTSPIFVLLFSFIFFKESISKVQVIAFALGLLGVFLIFGRNFEGFTFYHIFPILAGASYAIGVILTNRYCSKETPLTLLLCFLVAIGIVGFLITIWFTVYPVDDKYLLEAPFLFKGWQETDAFYWKMIVFVGLSGATAIYLMILAYQIGRPTYSAIYEYTYLISAGFFGWYLWGTVPTFLSFIGIIAIILAGTIIAINGALGRNSG